MNNAVKQLKTKQAQHVLDVVIEALELIEECDVEQLSNARKDTDAFNEVLTWISKYNAELHNLNAEFIESV